MKSGSDGRKTDAAAYREKAEQENRRDAAEEIEREAIVSQEAGRQFSEHLNKGRKIIVTTEIEFAPGERVGGMILMDEAGVERWWDQPFVITREATREEFEAERVPARPSKYAHSARARYYEVMAD